MLLFLWFFHVVSFPFQNSRSAAQQNAPPQVRQRCPSGSSLVLFIWPLWPQRPCTMVNCLAIATLQTHACTCYLTVFFGCCSNHDLRPRTAHQASRYGTVYSGHRQRSDMMHSRCPEGLIEPGIYGMQYLLAASLLWFGIFKIFSIFCHSSLMISGIGMVGHFLTH